MLNVVELVNYLRANPNQTSYIVDHLWINFYNKVSDGNGKIILGYPHIFIDSVNETLKHMDIIYNSVRNANCNLIWVSVFSKIRTVGLNYYIFILNKKFLNLEFRYSATKINIAEVKNEALVFMGLKPNFTREELIRRYRTLVLKYHPDKGGSTENFLKLQVYKEQLERSLC
jgi:hypothetical protein